MVHAQPKLPGENGSGFIVFIRDAIAFLGIIAVALPAMLFYLATRRLGSNQELSLGEDLRRSLIREYVIDTRHAPSLES